MAKDATSLDTGKDGKILPSVRDAARRRLAAIFQQSPTIHVLVKHSRTGHRRYAEVFCIVASELSGGDAGERLSSPYLQNVTGDVWRATGLRLNRGDRKPYGLVFDGGGYNVACEIKEALGLVHFCPPAGEGDYTPHQELAYEEIANV